MLKTQGVVDHLGRRYFGISCGTCVPQFLIRSHAQKYFLKVQKSGTSAHVPPPQPKRKAAHPCTKNVAFQDPGLYQPPAALPESGFLVGPDSLSVPGDSVNNAALSPWTYNKVTGFNLSYMTKGTTLLIKQKKFSEQATPSSRKAVSLFLFIHRSSRIDSWNGDPKSQ